MSKTKDYTSHSHLSNIYGWLRNRPPFAGDEIFLLSGRDMHSRWLERKPAGVKLPKKHQIIVLEVVDKLDKCQHAMKLHNKAEKEVTIISEINDVKVKVVLDIKRGATGADLKSTSTRSFESFVKSCIKYGYFRQANIYILVGKLKKFYFIAAQKKPPYEIFILDVTQYPEELEKAKKVVDFLLYIFKNYMKDIKL